MTLEEIAFHAATLAERREERGIARAMAEAAATGDVERFTQMADAIHWTVDGWAAAMRAIGRLSAVHPDIRLAFQVIWVETKMLPMKIGHRPTTAAALRKLMAGAYEGEPLRLYRGTRGSERRRRLYGFSWTTERTVAAGFAEHWRKAPEGAVILETVAPTSAVLWKREPGESFEEWEVVVDPFALGPVQVAEKWTRHQNDTAPIHQTDKLP